eukprot:CAMPEP_0196662250 /NCGR_PEP_ID=MMETSP1086-20130531/47857_1 /TAXON_ID=77921 /ORGANISM="Cyanoptyche  gloeocystis , Strain SAG4.97" /LENGTH=70 /DNA_ID=CAMNT_0041997521 /DNA_START=18 /DNA_END=227 /DNA_ORIENTATION=+
MSKLDCSLENSTKVVLAHVPDRDMSDENVKTVLAKLDLVQRQCASVRKRLSDLLVTVTCPVCRLEFLDHQ